jgi:uridine kinase
MKLKISSAILLRLIIVIIVIPSYLNSYFAPFLLRLNFDIDNWSSWLNSGGDNQSFPYGFAMLLVYLPSLIFSQILQHLALEPERALEIAVGLQMLAIETLFWKQMAKTKSMRHSLNIFLFSPLIIWVNYFLGLNDFFPSVCLFTASYFLLNHKYRTAGILMGIAIGMKFSLGLILPFLILFAWDNPRFKKNVWITSIVSVCTGAILYFPALYSQAFREMVFSNKESMKALGYFLHFGENRILILPLIYVLLLYWLWKAGRISVDVLIAFFGIALFLISAFSPASIGWMLWGLPLMFMNLAQEKRSRFQLVLIQILFLFHSLSIGMQIQTVRGTLEFSGLSSEIRNLTFTLAITLVALWSYSSLKTSIRHGDIYKIAKAPLTVSIAGDSGTGKDTLTNALKNMFTENTATVLCGDDYHKYERGDISWQNFTHLNPTANYLDLWEKDLRLAHRRKYFEQREYDHESGKFSQMKPKHRRDLVISQGLHGLYSRLIEKSDLCVFLSMSDDLRIKLKLNRDSSSRGHTRDSILASIKVRENDYLEFVAPQLENSDIHFHIYEVDDSLHLRIASNSNFVIDQFVGELASLTNTRIQESQQLTRKIYELAPGNIAIETLRHLLRNNISEFDQLFIEEPDIPENIIGIMATLSIILLTNKREEFYD